jgi:putative endonuclease
MSNKPNGVIYIGVTNNIDERVKEHKLKKYTHSFTAKYNCDKLIYLEEYDNEKDTSIREKQLKKWKRDWKLKLIEELNPSWMDITLNWNLDYKRNRNVKG